ncbi:unnamed protein product [Clonostachys solani]|uniref:Protein-S-isoprenylcysteine O-methyltransferase n=1 Tax=Clonostachys solani TaxID=160281 RepID=A0A9P0EPZ9_9HYPO|nr:unnamed protein product [Clonostachys solani]
MEPPGSFSQLTFAVSIIASITGSFVALSPPNPSTSTTPRTGDLLRRVGITSKHATKIALAPVGLLALHASALALYAPDIPRRLVGYGGENGLNKELITWSASTSVPICLILLVGVPLRLTSYSYLGTNFTFALAQPDRLTTTGIYRYVQHPSYTGLFAIMISTIALFVRFDGAVCCWIPPSLYPTARRLWFISVPVVLAAGLLGIRTRVRQEEDMLKDTFGRKWEEWHARTPRFLPWLF